jgi:hypothetical protein
MDSTWIDMAARAEAVASVTSAQSSTVLAAGDGRGLKLYWALLLLGCVLVCAPLWATTYPPLLDYPNHLARAYVTYHYDEFPDFQRTYSKLNVPVPNMAIDLVVPALLRFFEVRTAGKLFLTLMFVLFALGCHTLGVAIHGRPTWFALSFILLAFNQTVFWGFVNYFFGVGMFLLSASLWLRFRRQWNWWRLGIVAAFVLASYLTHLSAFAFLGVVLVTFTAFDVLQDQRLTRRHWLGLTPLLPPALTFLMFMRGPGEPGKLVWADATDKLLNLASWPVGYHYLLDGSLLGVLLLLAGWLCWRARAVHFARPVLVTGVLFWVLYLICPLAIFTSYSADIRFVAPAILFTLLAFRFEVGKRLGTVALAVFLLVSVVRLGGIWEAWQRIDRETAGQVALFQGLASGARVYPITFFPLDKEGRKNERPLHHAIHYATIYQHTFSPTFFAYKGQQPLLYRQRPRYAKITQRRPPETQDWSFIFGQNDYIWGYQLDAPYRQYLTALCDVVAENDGGLLLRIRKPAAQQIAAR